MSTKLIATISATVILATVTATFGRSAPASPPAAPSRPSPLIPNGEAQAACGVALRLDAAGVEAISDSGPQRMTGFLLSRARQVDLDLQPIHVLAPDVVLEVVGAGGVAERVLPPSAKLFRGRIVGAPDSDVFLALSAGSCHGWIRDGAESYILSSGNPGKAQTPTIYSLREAAQLGLSFAPFICAADQLPPPPGGLPPARQEDHGSGDPPCRVLNLAIETDYEYTASLFEGDAQQALAYVATLVGAVSCIYERDVNLRLVVTYVRLWSTPADPWDQSTTYGQLGQFRSVWEASQGSVPRHLAHFLSGRGLGGGVAWLGVVCHAYGYGLSANLGGYFPYPLMDSQPQNWDPFVVAHEIGHNVGARHTHDMNPPIDCCGGAYGGNGCGGVQNCTGAASGTVMSYCHLCAGGLANILMRLHDRTVAEDVLPYLSGLSCLGECGGDISNILQGKPVSVITGSVNGAPMWTLTDGVFRPQGTGWQDGTIWWYGTTTTLQIDLQETFTLRAAIVQADDNDSYVLECRNPSSGTWQSVWTIPAVGGGGMQTRPNPNNYAQPFNFPAPVTTDALRICAVSGDNSYSLSELQAFTQTFLPPPAYQRAVAMNGQVNLGWEAVADPTGQFQNYAVYRWDEPFTSVAGMTPIATLPSISTTSFEDDSAQNGVAYHYAVATVNTSGAQMTGVIPIGPRTPFDETDLQVVSISRTPRFPRYESLYTYESITEPSGFGPYNYSAATELAGGQTPNTQRWPNVGQWVTHTATVRNRGTNPWVGPIHGKWRVNGVVMRQELGVGPLNPGETKTFNFGRPWTGEAKDISFTLDASDSRLSNNSLTRNTKSVPFLSYIERSRIENFREETGAYPQAATDDFIDFLNHHMARFNQMFADAGSPKRVHFDVLEVIPDDAPDPTVDRINFAIFPFRYRASEASLRLTGYYSPEDDIDFGLLHEMGHQLGLIDLYQLNTPGEWNQVSGQPYSTVPCLMTGVSRFLSRHSALAMTHWNDVAHGYYGQYMYGIPSTVRMKFLGADGQPLVGATVKVYQRCERPGIGQRISNQVKAQGVTDADGVWTLPNVPIDPARVPPLQTGDALQANPFGYVAVIGTNGLLHFKVEKDGFVDYSWLDITETNVAFYEGQTQEATFERQVALGGPIERFPPPDMTELNAVRWRAWAQDGTASVADDSSRKRVGQSSVRLETTGGFDTSIRYPYGRLANWNLSGIQQIRFWAYAENPNIGFQTETPWVRLGNANGYFEWRSQSTLLNLARNQWYEFVVPVAGNSEWPRTVFGTPDFSRIEFLEIHADTWDAGFKLWVDGVRFSPHPVPGAGDLNCDGSTNLEDIQAMILALTDPNGFTSAFPTCYPNIGDINRDGRIDGQDIQGFTDLLIP